MLQTRLLAATFLLVAVAGVDNVVVHLMSFNIHNLPALNNGNSTCSDWNGIRKDNVVNTIRTVAADFVGTQETSDAQKAYLDAQLAGNYSAIGESSGQLNGESSEWNAVYYRTDSWRVLKNGMFWLGPNPNAMSAAWGMTAYRTCVWGRFQHISGATICVLNTHYETLGNNEAQEKGSNIILEKIKTHCDASDKFVVLLGDFNALKSHSAMQILYANNYHDSSDEGTYCGDPLSATCSVKYDFTLYRAQSDDVCHIKSEISRINYNGCYSSDHAALIGSYCLQGSCCLNSSIASGFLVNNSKGGANANGTADLVGTVMASDFSLSKNWSEVSIPDKDMDNSGLGSTNSAGKLDRKSTNTLPDSILAINTSSGASDSFSSTVAVILGLLGSCVVVALVVLRRKQTKERKAHLQAPFDQNASCYYAGPMRVKTTNSMTALSPEHHEEEEASSPIPELAAIPLDPRMSTTSSISVSESEVLRHIYRCSEVRNSNSLALLSQQHMRYSTAMHDCIPEIEGSFHTPGRNNGMSPMSSYSFADSYDSALRLGNSHQDLNMSNGTASSSSSSVA
ncbi:hypothetical protein CCR75_008166 [Bremia lactucae]|uniref:Endonuclease/exonuclease/phosphatase domain-containing protein n=1 Tax=Bremia lactucae TaxID=4779 RepID=A0A976FJK9_BRELC|nr:hypothetical protein CCR75_008166 [Bremia lactucae]